MRGWHEWVAGVGDLVPGGVPVIGIGLLMVTTIGAMLWYFWPEWLPTRGNRRGTAAGGPAKRRRRWRLGWRGLRRRFGRLRWRWPAWRLRWRLRWRRRRQAAPAPADLPADQLPELPAAALVLSADELAAQRRYKEAVRERLRAIVRELIEREVVDHRPGWTVTELAAMAATGLPAAAPPLGRASELFSGIWYGQREAKPGDDTAMRQYAQQVRAALASAPPGSGGPAEPAPAPSLGGVGG